MRFKWSFRDQLTQRNIVWNSFALPCWGVRFRWIFLSDYIHFSKLVSAIVLTLLQSNILQHPQHPHPMILWAHIKNKIRSCGVSIRILLTNMLFYFTSTTARNQVSLTLWAIEVNLDPFVLNTLTIFCREAASQPFAPSKGVKHVFHVNREYVKFSEQMLFLVKFYWR